ncbi:MAG TPA: HAMP domain-containing sensor histidine kinase [Candidatus Dormibacteraeota bacterium]
MNPLLSLVQLLVSLLFILLGLLALRAWLRDRNASSGWLALAIGSLSAVSLLGRVQTSVEHPTAFELLGDLDLALFLLSGYALLRFRATFIPLDARAHVAVVALLLTTGVVAIATRIGAPPSAHTGTPAWLRQAIVIEFILAWGLCVLDPVIRFAWASRNRPAVQRARLQSLSVGFGLLVLILLVAGAAPALANNPDVQLATQLLALVSVPLIYASLSPPVWLRRTWRDREAEALRLAIRDLILFSPSRQVMAERALEWAQRLVGADAALIADSDGSPLAAHGVWPDSVKGLLHDLEREPAGRIVRLTDAEQPGSAMILPLPLDAGTGALIVLSGPYTPYFGSDELQWLGGYATSITVALDRAILTERIAALERAKTEFLNLASHELRGPITLIRGYLDMLASGSLGAVSKELNRVLPALQIKADEMNALIEQMIEAARLEEGRLELHPVETDLRELAKKAVEVIAPLTDKEHKLKVETPAQEVRATVDPERVSTILTNLLSNAIKYSPRGGEVRCVVTREGGMAVVEVSDQGVGIAPEEMDRLFTRFGRIANLETRHIGGTGLGLYLSRQLARMQGGDVTVSSTPGKGSTFRFAVPLTQ